MGKALTIWLLTAAFTISNFCFSASASTNSNWMGSLDASKSLAELSIPGSHDSGALFERFSGTAKCQSLTIADQLDAGIRYLDIRCRHVNDAFDIYHGSVFQNLNFDAVLDACSSFLKAHPTECAIMSVKEEHDPSNNTRAFEKTFDFYVAKNPDVWLLTGTIPTLRQARGKIVLLRRFKAGSLLKGIDATKWGDNRTFEINNGPVHLKIQDQYMVPDNEAKWSSARKFYDEAAITNRNLLYINFTSGYHPGLLGVPSIPSVSDFMNPAVSAYFTTNKSGRFGITVMDFADAAKCRLIIATNH